jgi:predicted GNAT family N-acyltransferase
MLEHFEGIVRAAGCKKLVLDARLTAQAFYESHGFIPVGEVFVMAIAPVDHIAMEKHF